MSVLLSLLYTSGIESFIDIILCHLHLTTVARAPFWWAANSGMMRIRTGSSSRTDSIGGRFTQFIPSEN